MENLLTIHSSSREYCVHVGPGLLHDLGVRLRRLPVGRPGARGAVISDETVAALFADAVLISLRASGFLPTLITVPAGETSKSMSEVARVADRMIAAGLDRHGFVVALGGGVIGDLAGFVASVYYRGIPFVQIPTTVVAQVDSSIGGKTGVNTAAGKNLLGAFYPPHAVFVDIDTLQTLPEREFNEGFGEIIKHGVIRDAALLGELSGFERADTAGLTRIIRRNLEIKAKIVAADEFETRGFRALLNFGHTVGHAIEQAAGYGRFLHGEAVSLGMVAAGYLSMAKCGLSHGEFAEVKALLGRFKLPVVLPRDLTIDAVMEGLWRDKKFENGAIRFVLTPRLGEAFLSEPGRVSRDDLRVAVESLRTMAD